MSTTQYNKASSYNVATYSTAYFNKASSYNVAI